MKKLILIIIPLLILSSCAFNGMFLVPYKLSEEDSFTGYSEEHKDSITLTLEGKEPHFRNSQNEEVSFGYTFESIHFKGSNNDTINAWLIEPKENFNGTMLYFLHGNAGNLVYQYRLVTPFVERGYKVFMVDYSGFGFTTGDATRENVLQSGYDGFDYLKQSDIKYDRIVIYGQSLGGHMAAVVGNKYQDDVEGVVIEGGFSSHKDVASTRIPILSRIFIKEMYSGKDSIQKIKKPVLIIHSEEDKIVKYKLGKKLYKKASEPKELYTIDNRHIYGPLLYADSIDSRILKLSTYRSHERPK
jgi:dipeptidyl aminopeptidase/acylaminoacyl peptidase